MKRLSPRVDWLNDVTDIERFIRDGDNSEQDDSELQEAESRLNVQQNVRLPDVWQKACPQEDRKVTVFLDSEAVERLRCSCPRAVDLRLPCAEILAVNQTQFGLEDLDIFWLKSFSAELGQVVDAQGRQPGRPSKRATSSSTIVE